MPQITIEYSSNLKTAFAARNFAGRVHDQIAAIIDTELVSCKTRLVMLDDVVIGDGSDDHAMIHVDLRILSGRSDEQKRRLGEAVAAALDEAVEKPGPLKLQLTVEVRDLDREHYHKRLL